jgi:hypothetical protein
MIVFVSFTVGHGGGDRKLFCAVRCVFPLGGTERGVNLRVLMLFTSCCMQHDNNILLFADIVILIIHENVFCITRRSPLLAMHPVFALFAVCRGLSRAATNSSSFHP